MLYFMTPPGRHGSPIYYVINLILWRFKDLAVNSFMQEFGFLA